MLRVKPVYWSVSSFFKRMIRGNLLECFVEDWPKQRWNGKIDDIDNVFQGDGVLQFL